MLNRKHYEHVFVREILCLKINSLKILKNAKNTSEIALKG